MGCKKEECCQDEKKNIQVNTTKDGTWIINNGEDLHVYSTSLCEGGNGSVIGFNNRAIMKSKISATPLVVVMQDGKIWLQTVSDDNIMSRFDVCKDKFYDLLMDFLLDVRDTCLVVKPTEVVDLNK